MTTDKIIPTTTRINKLLAKAGHQFRLVRGRGYYYLHGEGSGALYSTSIYAYRLEPQDFDFARSEVNALLRAGNLATI